LVLELVCETEDEKPGDEGREFARVCCAWADDAERLNKRITAL